MLSFIKTRKHARSLIIYDRRGTNEREIYIYVRIIHCCISILGFNAASFRVSSVRTPIETVLQPKHNSVSNRAGSGIRTTLQRSHGLESGLIKPSGNTSSQVPRAC